MGPWKYSVTNCQVANLVNVTNSEMFCPTSQYVCQLKEISAKSKCNNFQTDSDSERDLDSIRNS